MVIKAATKMYGKIKLIFKKKYEEFLKTPSHDSNCVGIPNVYVEPYGAH